jgi:hypothetical protein
MEQTQAGTDGGRKLVLGFDAGCLTCSELARRIEERVGGEIEVRSLNDPVVRHWRKRALGDAAPWAPTLVELDGGAVRAWTGVRMGVRLSRALGPLATWRIMQVLGEANADLELTDSVAARATSGFTRGQFLKGVGGVAVALSILGGTGKLASPAGAATSSRIEEMSGEELIDVARAVATRKDVANVTTEAWRDKVRSGRVIEAGITDDENNRAAIEAIDLDDGRVTSAESELVFSGDLAVVKAARHVLSDGNSMVAVSFAMPQDDRLVVYYEYEKPVFLPKDQAKTRTEALLYQVENDSVVLKKASSNRQPQTLLQEGTSSRAIQARHACLPDRRCNNPCDIVYGYSRCHRLKSIGCVAYQCRACAITCWGGALLCAACAVVICSWGVIRECCRGGYGCKRCGWCH